MHTHTSITLYAPTRHSTCIYAAVLHTAASTQSSQHVFLYLNAYDALTQLSHTQSHSQPLNNTSKPTARAISITLAPTSVSLSDRSDSEYREGKYESKSKSNMNKNKSKLGKST